MAQAKVNWPDAYDLSLAAASLASDTNLLTGVQSAPIDNSTNGYRDFWISAKFTTGTSPTSGRVIELWGIGAFDKTNNLWPDVFDSTASAETISLAANKSSIARYVGSVVITSTSDEDYYIGPVLASSVFGGDVPPVWCLFLTQSSAVNLNATAANHYVRIQPIYDTVS
jgi:hypothetical protein